MSDPAQPSLRLRVAAAPVGQAPSAQAIALTNAAIAIGRGDDNDLVLPDPLALVSRRHCRVTPAGGVWQVEDSSTNGTLVNDVPVPHGRPAPIQPGDSIRRGDYGLAVELAGGGAAGDAPIAAPAAVASHPVDPFGVGDLAQRTPHDFAGDAGGPAIPPDANLFDDLSRPDEAARPQPSRAPFDEPWPARPEPVGPAAAGPAPFDAHAVPVPRADNAIEPGGLPDDWMEPVAATPTPAPKRAARMPVADDAPAAAPPSDELLRAFLAGAGIDSLPAGTDPASAMRALGEASRIMLGTFARLLAARRAIKGEFRVTQTVIGARDNNPLKFSADEGEMLLLMLGAVRPGFLSGPAALADACRDLEAHQLSLLAGFRAALDLLLQRLSPETIAAGAKGGLLSGKSKQWERYEAVYGELRRDVANNFAGQLGQAFTAAYEAEAKRHG